MKEKQDYWDYSKLNEALEELPGQLLQDFDEQELYNRLNVQTKWLKLRRVIEIALPIAIILLIIFVI